MSNYILGDLIVKLNVGSKGHLDSIEVLNTKLSLQILQIFYKIGLIRSFQIISEKKIKIFFKYYKNRPIFMNLVLITTPGKKVYWSLNKLSLNYNIKTFAGFYLISTSKGLMLSNDCLLNKHLGGKILLKIYL